MVLPAKKTQITEKPSAQYSRLQRLLSFSFFDKPAPKTTTETSNDDFIDIVLEADFSHSGKVKGVR
jgi:hypothetical protein